PLTGVGQSVARAGDRWAAEMTLPPLTAAQARSWAAVIVQLAGGLKAVYVPPPMTLQAFGGIDPKVQGGSQVGEALAIDGLTGLASIPEGTFFSYDTSTFRMLHITTASATVTTGAATLPI